MTDGLAWAVSGPVDPVRLPSKSAIFQARDRLGAEPLKRLFARVARPLATEVTPGSWLAGRRLVAIDARRWLSPTQWSMTSSSVGQG